MIKNKNWYYKGNLNSYGYIDQIHSLNCDFNHDGYGLTNKQHNRLRKMKLSFSPAGRAEHEDGSLGMMITKIESKKSGYESWTINNMFPYKVFVIGQIDKKDEINEYIWCVAINKIRTKYGNLFQERIGMAESSYRNKIFISGWVSLENEFMWFVDKKMFDNFVKEYKL